MPKFVKWKAQSSTGVIRTINPKTMPVLHKLLQREKGELTDSWSKKSIEVRDQEEWETICYEIKHSNKRYFTILLDTKPLATVEYTFPISSDDLVDQKLSDKVAISKLMRVSVNNQPTVYSIVVDADLFWKATVTKKNAQSRRRPSERWGEDMQHNEDTINYFRNKMSQMFGMHNF